MLEDVELDQTQEQEVDQCHLQEYMLERNPLVLEAVVFCVSFQNQQEDVDFDDHRDEELDCWQSLERVENKFVDD